MVEAFNSDTKGTLAQESHDFVSVSDVIFDRDTVVAFAIVEAEVLILAIRAATGCSSGTLLDWWLVHDWLYFLNSFTEVKDVWVVKNLCPFVLCQVVNLLL